MTDNRPEIDEADLHAFVDGHLPPDRRRAAMANLAASPDQAARASDYRALNEAMHLTYDEVLHEPLPARLRVGRYVHPEAGRSGAFSGLAGPGQAMRAAALIALALASGFAGWSLNDRMSPAGVESEASSFARNAAQAHAVYTIDGRHPVEFGADQEDTLLLWLSDRLGTTIQAPSLQAVGLRLVGGRLLPSSGRPAGQLMYEGEAGQRITLYIRGRFPMPSGSLSGWHEDTVRYGGETGGVSLVYWATGGLAYALIGQMDREQLLATAKLVQEQLQIPSITPAAPVDQATEKGAT
ncbi:MAG TPA: anti-sigma factor [Geminicoccaceae bacterium]